LQYIRSDGYPILRRFCLRAYLGNIGSAATSDKPYRREGPIIMPVAEYKVPEISCEGCANAIKRALTSEPGVEQVDVDLDAKTVRVTYDADRSTADAIRDRIGEAGYDTTEMTTG